MVTLESRIARTKDVVFTPLDDAIIMMSLESGHYHELDSIGAAIWNELEEPQNVGDLCSELHKHYDVDRTDCERDVLEFLNQLHDLNVIVTR